MINQLEKLMYTHSLINHSFFGCTRIVGKGVFWVKQIVLTNVIYFLVQNIVWFHKGGKWWMFHTYK